MQCLSWVRSTNVPQKRYLFWDSIFWGTEGTSKNYLVPKVPQKIIYSAKGTTNNFLLPSTTVPEKIFFLEVCVHMGQKIAPFAKTISRENATLYEKNLKRKCDPARKKFEGKIALFLRYVWNCRDKHWLHVREIEIKNFGVATLSSNKYGVPKFGT